MGYLDACYRPPPPMVGVRMSHEPHCAETLKKNF